MTISYGTLHDTSIVAKCSIRWILMSNYSVDSTRDIRLSVFSWRKKIRNRPRHLAYVLRSLIFERGRGLFKGLKMTWRGQWKQILRSLSFSSFDKSVTAQRFAKPRRLDGSTSAGIGRGAHTSSRAYNLRSRWTFSGSPRWTEWCIWNRDVLKNVGKRWKETRCVEGKDVTPDKNSQYLVGLSSPKWILAVWETLKQFRTKFTEFWRAFSEQRELLVIEREVREWSNRLTR